MRRIPSFSNSTLLGSIVILCLSITACKKDDPDIALPVIVEPKSLAENLSGLYEGKRTQSIKSQGCIHRPTGDSCYTQYGNDTTQTRLKVIKIDDQTIQIIDLVGSTDIKVSIDSSLQFKGKLNPDSNGSPNRFEVVFDAYMPQSIVLNTKHGTVNSSKEYTLTQQVFDFRKID